MSKIIVECTVALSYAPRRPYIKEDGKTAYKEGKVRMGNQFEWLGDPHKIPKQFMIVEGKAPPKPKAKSRVVEPQAMTQDPGQEEPVTAGGMSGAPESHKTEV